MSIDCMNGRLHDDHGYDRGIHSLCGGRGCTTVLIESLDRIQKLTAELAETKAEHQKWFNTAHRIQGEAVARAQAAEKKLAETREAWKRNHDMWRDEAGRYRAALEQFAKEPCAHCFKALKARSALTPSVPADAEGVEQETP